MRTLDEQIERLVELRYPTLLNCPAEELRRSLGQLRTHLPARPSALDVDNGTIGFILVVNCASAPVEKTLPLVVRGGRAAIERLFPRSPDFFRPIASVSIPSGHAYLLLDVDRGNDTLNAVPSVAQAQLASKGRTPLTVEEGVAVLTQYPEFLQPNRCFMMLGSRGDDKRVPALWLSGKQPKLGWCWEGNPHSWLGFASCGVRSPGVDIATPAASTTAPELLSASSSG